MNAIVLPLRIKEYRKRKGFSQEHLAETTGLSLRTIQRIEKGETEPRGDTIKRLANAFAVSPDELSDWTLEEDRGHLMGLNLSGLICMLFPVLGIIVTLIIWWSKKDQVKGSKELGRKVLNFQITWNLLFFLTIVLSAFWITRVFDRIEEAEEISPAMVSGSMSSIMTWITLSYIFFNGYNVIITIVNTYRLHKGKSARYFPQIPIIRK